MATDFPYNSTTPLNSDGFAFNLDQLRDEIVSNVLITTALDYIRGSGKEDITVTFVANLSGAEEAQLNNTVALHVPDDARPAFPVGFDANRFVFRPGGPEELGPIVFSKWSDLIALFNQYTDLGRRTILFDDTYENPDIPAGSYDMTDTILEGVSPVDRTQVCLLNGVSFTGIFAELQRIRLIYEGGAVGHITTSAQTISLQDSTIESTAAPLIQFKGAFNHYILMNALSEINNGGNYPVQLGDTLASLSILVPAESQIGTDALADVPGANEMSVAAFGVDNVDPNQPNLANTTLSSGNRKVLLAKANDYDPSGSVTPLVATDVQAAIDELDFNFQAGSSQYGNNHEYYEDETPQTVTGTTIPQPVATFITAVIPAGDYYVEWYIESAISSNNNVTQMQIELDAVNIASTEQNTRTSTSFFPTSGFAMRTLNNASHTMQVLAAPDQIGRTSFIQRIRLRLHRIS